MLSVLAFGVAALGLLAGVTFTAAIVLMLWARLPLPGILGVNCVCGAAGWDLPSL